MKAKDYQHFGSGYNHNESSGKAKTRTDRRRNNHNGDSKSGTTMGWTANKNDTSMEKKKQVWTDRLHLNRVGDILRSNGNLWTH